MAHRKGFPRIVKTVRPFTPEHPVAGSIRRGSKWFDAWVAQMTTPYHKITRKTGITLERLIDFARGSEPTSPEVAALAALWYVTPDGLATSIRQSRTIDDETSAQIWSG